jgi:hypothetical protein
MIKPNNVSSQLLYLAPLIPNLLAIAAPSQALFTFYGKPLLHVMGGEVH